MIFYVKLRKVPLKNYFLFIYKKKFKLINQIFFKINIKLNIDYKT